MRNITVIIPSSFNHEEEQSTRFLSEISLLSIIDECLINISWYAHEESSTRLQSTILFIKDLLNIREQVKIYKTLEAAIVSHLCSQSRSKQNSDIIVLFPRNSNETSASSLSSLFTSCDNRIILLSTKDFRCNSNKHFSFSYRDTLWPTKILQSLLYNSVRCQNSLENVSASEELLPKQSLFWLCSRCFTGIIMYLLLVQTSKTSQCLCSNSTPTRSLN